VHMRGAWQFKPLGCYYEAVYGAARCASHYCLPSSHCHCLLTDCILPTHSQSPSELNAPGVLASKRSASFFFKAKIGVFVVCALFGGLCQSIAH
jgi:hypothetical protein